MMIFPGPHKATMSPMDLKKKVRRHPSLVGVECVVTLEPCNFLLRTCLSKVRMPKMWGFMSVTWRKCAKLLHR